jgi:hypothetical protein
MGSITYGGNTIGFEDRLLEHLYIVIVQKLRRGESFTMSWKDALAVGDGRSAIWLTPDMPIYFKFDGSRVPTISQPWLTQLSESASSSRGLIVTDEQGQLARSTGAPRVSWR